MPSTRVSAVITAWNAEATLERAIRSALAERPAVGEVIVADDGSTDGTAAIAAGFGDDVRLLRLPHRGQAAATNAGIEAARGDLVAILHDDDEWVPGKTARSVAALDAAPRAAVAYTDLLLVRPDGSGAGTFLADKPFAASGRVFEALLAQCFVLPSAVTFRREAFREAGLSFDDDLVVAVDYDVWLRAARRFEFVRVAEPLVRRLLRPGAAGTDLKRLRADHVRIFRRLREQVVRDEGPAAAPLAVLDRRLAGFEAGLGYDRYRAGDVAGARRLLAASLGRRPAARTALLWLLSLGGRPGRSLVAAARGWQE